ncbi:hypothetical protein F5148DRAFT_1154397 [Russula earlei]|uniref:Uncharacterized protein n=1 Tax=Russula earlei TaxID=71964 RepID=A0ACC0TU16_9AGAM|nr:hypothetical protein F5148DRAFT_1154397 [Russula earlei]
MPSRNRPHWPSSITRAHGIGGKRVGVAEGRVEHEDGVDDEDEQLAKGEAGRDAEVERVHERRVHDLRPAGHARRRAAVVRWRGLAGRAATACATGGGGRRRARGGDEGGAGFVLVLGHGHSPSDVLLVLRHVDDRPGAAMRVCPVEVGVVVRARRAGMEEEAVEDLRGRNKRTRARGSVRAAYMAKRESKMTSMNHGYHLVTEMAVNEPEKKGKKNLQKPQHVRAAGSVGTLGMLLLAMARFHTERTWRLIVVVMAIVVAVSALSPSRYHLERGKLVRGR